MLPPGGTYAPPSYAPPLGQPSYHPLSGTEHNQPMYDDPPTPEELEEMNKPFIPRDWYKQRRFQSTSLPNLIWQDVSLTLSSFSLHSRCGRPSSWSHSHYSFRCIPREDRKRSRSFCEMDEKPKGWMGDPYCDYDSNILPTITRPRASRAACWRCLGTWNWIRYRRSWNVVRRTSVFLVSAFVSILIELTFAPLSQSVFKYWCTGRAEKVEQKNLFYGCLARAIRQGGFKMALLARLSVIPSHCMSSSHRRSSRRLHVLTSPDIQSQLQYAPRAVYPFGSTPSQPSHLSRNNSVLLASEVCKLNSHVFPYRLLINLII